MTPVKRLLAALKEIGRLTRDRSDLPGVATRVDEAIREAADLESSAMAIQKDALEKTRAEADALRVLLEIARITTSDGELRPILQKTVEALSHGFDWEFVACVSIDEDAKRFVCEAVTSDFETEIVPGYGRALGSGVVGQVATTGEPVLLDDVRRSTNYVETMPGALSELCVPVKHAGKVIAVLNLESRRLAAFHDQLPLLSTVAEQVAGAIHLVATNQRLKEANRRLSEAEAQIAKLLAGGHQPEELSAWSSGVATEVARIVNAREIDIWLVEDGVPVRLTSGHTRSPSAELLRSLPHGDEPPRPRPESDELLVPIEGPSGDVFGALVVAGAPSNLVDSGRRLLAVFARQLGGTLELQRTRQQLAAAEAQRAERREDLHRRGIATLQVCPRCGRCYSDDVKRCETDGAPLDASWLLPRRLADRFTLLRRIGQGGMGTVFAASDEKLEREVAIKLIRPEHLANVDFASRFQREARAVARIHHPGVVALFDSGELEDGSLFLAMELLQGKSVAQLLDEKGRGSYHEVAALLREGAASLAAAHRAGVVHRDVKPQNFFRAETSEGRRFKLFDFGLARTNTLAGAPGITKLGMVVGTPAYMSPEQARGLLVDERSDLYSFALVAYETLIGDPVVKSFDLGRIMVEILSEAPPRASRALPSLPESIDRAFEHALAKNRDVRPPSLVDWAESLASLLESLPAEGDTSGWD